MKTQQRVELRDRTPIDYGHVDVSEPAVEAAAEFDHQHGIHHTGLPCCDDEAAE